MSSRTAALALACMVLWLPAGCGRRASVDSDRAVKLEVAYAQGTGADGLAQALAIELGKALHRPVTVAQGRPASLAPIADPSVLLVASSDAVVVAPAETGAGVRSGGLCPLALLGDVPHVLAVAADSNLDSIASIAAAARQRPGSLAYGTLEPGTATDVLGERFAAALDLDLVHTRYRTIPSALHDVLAGDLTMMFATLGIVVPSVRSGALRVVAVSSARRVAELPGVPTFAEAGLPQLQSSTWYGLFAACDLSTDAADPLFAAAEQAVAAPAVSFTLGRPGLADGTTLLGPDFAAFVQASAAYWADAVAALHPDARDTAP